MHKQGVQPENAVIAPQSVVTDPDRMNKRKFDTKKKRQSKAGGEFKEVMNELGLINVDVETWRQLTRIELENSQSWQCKALIKFCTALEEKENLKNVIMKSKEDYEKTVKM
eukprot:504615-Rhodomonas_salina.1